MHPGSQEIQPLPTFLPPVTSLRWVPPLPAGGRDQLVWLGKAPVFLLPFEDQGLCGVRKQAGRHLPQVVLDGARQA